MLAPRSLALPAPTGRAGSAAPLNCVAPAAEALEVTTIIRAADRPATAGLRASRPGRSRCSGGRAGRLPARCEPQSVAIARARSSAQNGSSVLMTASDGNGSGWRTMGTNECSTARTSSRSTSGGATSSAARTRAVLRECAAHAGHQLAAEAVRDERDLRRRPRRPRARRSPRPAASSSRRAAGASSRSARRARRRTAPPSGSASASARSSASRAAPARAGGATSARQGSCNVIALCFALNGRSSRTARRGRTILPRPARRPRGTRRFDAMSTAPEEIPSSTSTARKARPACASTRCSPRAPTSSCCASRPSCARTTPSARACSTPPTSRSCACPTTPRAPRRRWSPTRDTCLIDASTAHRTDPSWVYGLPELAPGQREALRTAKRIANPGCHATAFILLMRPLVDAGLVAPDADVTRDVHHRLLGRRQEDDRAVPGLARAPDGRRAPDRRRAQRAAPVRAGPRAQAHPRDEDLLAARRARPCSCPSWATSTRA